MVPLETGTLWFAAPAATVADVVAEAAWPPAVKEKDVPLGSATELLFVSTFCKISVRDEGASTSVLVTVQVTTGVPVEPKVKLAPLADVPVPAVVTEQAKAGADHCVPAGAAGSPSATV